MQAFAETVAALGCPVFLRTIGGEPSTLIARWKHGDARVEFNSADAVRVCLSLRGGHTVRMTHSAQPATTIVGGCVGVFPADRYSDVHIEGQADVVQIFIAPSHLDDLAERRVAMESSFVFNYPKVQSAVLQAYLSARAGGPDDGILMESSLLNILEQLVAHRVQDNLKSPRRGLAWRTIQRIDKLIADRFDGSEMRAPSLSDLARAAGMSVSHFVRVFRESTGATPHQHVLTRRIERAMGLLAEPARSVAEVADSTGYASPAHFVASFRRRLGITPGIYRQAIQN